MTILILALILVGMWLAGCTHFAWTKTDFSETEFARDSYECERDARQSGYFGTGHTG
jgi:hypothetical protein